MAAKKRLIITTILLVIIILGAGILYKALVKNVKASPDFQKDEKTNGKLAEDFVVQDYDGKSVALSDYFGKPIIVNFWATWCPPCKAELPDFNNAYQAYGDDLQFMMVNLTDGNRETVKSVKNFVADNHFIFPVYFDTRSEAAYAYNIFSIPTTLFINKDGEIVDTRIGMITEDYLLEQIEKLLK